MSLLWIIILLNNIFSNLHIRNIYRNFASRSETDGGHAFQNDASAGFPQGDYITLAIRPIVGVLVCSNHRLKVMGRLFSLNIRHICVPSCRILKRCGSGRNYAVWHMWIPNMRRENGFSRPV